MDVAALDKLREALSEALGKLAMRGGYGLGVLASERLAADLLPVVDRIANERAAAELQAAVVEISRDRDNCPNKIRRQGYGGALFVLKARHAAALRADHLDPS